MNPINCRDVPHPDDPECCTIVQCDEGPTVPFGEGSLQHFYPEKKTLLFVNLRSFLLRENMVSVKSNTI